MNTSTHLVAFLGLSLNEMMPGDQVGVFDSHEHLCGFMKVNDTKNNSTITLFGDDPTTNLKDGFTEGEFIYFKLYRPSTDETFDLDVEYATNYDNDGTYKLNGISVISGVKLSVKAR